MVYNGHAKLMELAKCKFTPFQAMKLTCMCSDSEVKTLKATVSQHEEDSSRELFSIAMHAKAFDFLPTKSPFICVYLEKTLLNVLRNICYRPICNRSPDLKPSGQY